MGKYDKILQKLLSGTSDANIHFAELRHILIHFGFDERVRGDHHIFTKNGIEEILNLQPKKSMAKLYQVKQVRNIILKYKIGGDHAE